MPTEQEVEAAFSELFGASRAMPRTDELLRQMIRQALGAAEHVRAPKSFACADGAELRALHRKRAQIALASHRCATDLTNGLCAPKDGHCHYETRTDGHAVSGCMAQAAALLKAMESRGLCVVWEYDPALSFAMEKRP
ncbi:MAG: hypothetical protein GC182_08670 [Rhodopseudomonas sp.]|nr:hypothetical protein [Rhodopseudomonas sp.]